MNRFYIDKPVYGGKISFSDPEQLHHMKNVLRLKPGDQVVVFDNEGNVWVSIINSIKRKEAILEIKERKPPQPGANTKISIACAVPKQSRMDDIIDKLTQLGVDSIIPLVTERANIQREDMKESRLMRWKKIARSAAEQSGRNRLPLISPIKKISEVLEQAAKYDLKLVPTLTVASQPIREVLPDQLPANTLVLIGPEGDFSLEEVQLILKAGYQPVSLGPTVLRVETAALAVASFLRLIWM